MQIYLADLIHNYFRGQNTVPLNVGYLASYAKKQFGDDVSISLFKYADDLLDAVKKSKPDLLGMSNYTWSARLNAFVGNRIKKMHPDLPIVMGGPSIRTDNVGIASFLEHNPYVDTYCLFDGEIPFSSIVGKLLGEPSAKRTGEFTRNIDANSCYSLRGGNLFGNHKPEIATNLDFIPSPYLDGTLDAFIAMGLNPIFESNRGRPYSCSYCNWGSTTMNKLQKFSLERVKAEMEYVEALDLTSPVWILADANFGILKRDLEIAEIIINMTKKRKESVVSKKPPFYFLSLYWDKNAKHYFEELARKLHGFSQPYVAFQSMDPLV